LAGIKPPTRSIDVLKDASGGPSMGGVLLNGVIIVTTKRGKDGKATLTYDGYTGAGTPWKKLDVLNTNPVHRHAKRKIDPSIATPANSGDSPMCTGKTGVPHIQSAKPQHRCERRHTHRQLFCGRGYMINKV